MEKEILDEHFKDENEVQPNWVNWTSIIILWIGIVLSFLSGIISDIQSIAAIVLLVIATIISYLNFNLGVKITFGIILVGVFNLVKFTPISYNLLLEINDFKIGFEMVLFVVGLIHYFSNKEQLSIFMKDLINRDVSEEEIVADKRTRVNGFKKRFSKKKISELREIATNEILVPEANRAAKELLEEKNKNYSDQTE